MKYTHSRRALYNRLFDLSIALEQIDLQVSSTYDNEVKLNDMYESLSGVIDDLLAKDEPKHNTKFEIGQYVKVVGKNLSDRILGQVGKVVAIRDDDRGRYASVDLAYEVEFDGSDVPRLFYEDEIKAVESSKLSVGQEVEVIKSLGQYPTAYVGKKGHIVNIVDNDKLPYPFVVVFDEGYSDWFLADELKPVVSAKPPVSK
jgi:hypothetical protein